MVNVIVILEIDPARVDEFLDVMLRNAAESIKEPGCKAFEVNRHSDQRNLFGLYESYLDQAALIAHTETKHFAQWKDLTASGIVLKRWAAKGPVIDAGH